MKVMSKICLALALLSACAGSMGSSWNGGIHARMRWSEEGGLRVAEVPDGGPAALAGLRPDDVILAIDSEPLEGRPMAQVVEMLRGPVGTTVILSVRRGTDLRTVEVERAPYQRE